MPLPWRHFRRGFDDFAFRGVHHDWDFANVRFAGDEVEKAHHRRNAVESCLRPCRHRSPARVRTCWRATTSAASYSPALMSCANFGEPATLVRSPMLMKIDRGVSRNRLGARFALISANRERVQTAQGAMNGSAAGTLRGTMPAHGDRRCFDVRRSGAATAATMFSQPFSAPFAQLRREGFRRFREGRCATMDSAIRHSDKRSRKSERRSKALNERTQFLGPPARISCRRS